MKTKSTQKAHIKNKIRATASLVLALILTVIALSGCVTLPAIPTFTPPPTTQYTPTTVPPITTPTIPTSTPPVPTAPTITTFQLPFAPKVTFTVTVPLVTPPEDTIYLRTATGQDIKMTKIDKLTWQAEYSPAPWIPLTYGYHRNGVGYEASEEITAGDTEQDWYKKRSVTANISQNVIQKDEVKKWRWLLNEPPKVELVKETTEFLPRVAGWSFQKGIYVIDYWWNVFFENGETENTAQRIIQDNADVVQYSPTWALKLTDNGIELDKSISYGYPDEAIRYETQTAKKAGLKVAYRNQVWLDITSDMVTKERSAQWWEQYYQTRRQYLLEMAQIAADEGVDTLCIGDGSDSLTAFTDWGSAPAASWTRWVEDIREVRKIFKGKIYYAFVISGKMEDTYELDWAKWQPILNEVDFIGISWWKGVSNKDDITLPDLKKNVAEQFDRNLKPIYEKTSKPILLIGVVFPSADGGTTGKYSWNARATDVWKPDDGTYNDFQEQADAFEAVMSAAASRPWIIGAYPFGFWRHDQQDKGPNIRGKPAEEVLKKWYGAIK